MHLGEHGVHLLPVRLGLHIAVRGAAHQHQPVGILVHREVQIGLAEVHDGIIAAGRIGRGLAQLDQKMFQHIESRGQEQFFLVAIVVRQQSKGHTSPVGNLLEGGFHIATFTKKFLGGLEQGFFFIFCSHGHCGG